MSACLGCNDYQFNCKYCGGGNYEASLSIIQKMELEIQQNREKSVRENRDLAYKEMQYHNNTKEQSARRPWIDGGDY